MLSEIITRNLKLQVTNLHACWKCWPERNHHTESQEKKHQLVSPKSLVPVIPKPALCTLLVFKPVYSFSLLLSFLSSSPHLLPSFLHSYFRKKISYLLKIPHKTLLFLSQRADSCRTGEWYKRAGRRPFLDSHEWVLQDCDNQFPVQEHLREAAVLGLFTLPLLGTLVPMSFTLSSTTL